MSYGGNTDFFLLQTVVFNRRSVMCSSVLDDLVIAAGFFLDNVLSAFSLRDERKEKIEL